MEKATKEYLAKIAEEKAQIPFHGYVDGKKSNLEPIIRFFPKCTLWKADRLWCAAFVYYCCREAGFDIPYRPSKYIDYHLGSCLGWEEFAINDERIEYNKLSDGFIPKAGDIVLYDRVFNNQEHDHIGIVVEKTDNLILAAEGNINNVSGIIERPLDEHIRAFIRISDGYRY